MNPETKQILESKMLETLQWVEQSIKTTSDFASEQVPLYIQELLVYNFWMSLIWFIVGILFLIPVFFFVKLLKRYWVDEDEAGCFLTGILILASLLISMITTSSNTDWIKIKLAPRVYIVDYLRSEIK